MSVYFREQKSILSYLGLHDYNAQHAIQTYKSGPTAAPFCLTKIQTSLTYQVPLDSRPQT